MSKPNAIAPTGPAAAQLKQTGTFALVEVIPPPRVSLTKTFNSSPQVVASQRRAAGVLFPDGPQRDLAESNLAQTHGLDRGVTRGTAERGTAEQGTPGRGAVAQTDSLALAYGAKSIPAASTTPTSDRGSRGIERGHGPSTIDTNLV